MPHAVVTVAVTILALVAAAAIAGCAPSRSRLAEPGRWVAAGDAPSTTRSSSPSDPPSPSSPPSPAMSPSPSPARQATARRAATVKPAPTRRPAPPPAAPPPNRQAPPPVTGSPSPGATCPTLTGPPASSADVRQALVAAAGTAVWPRIGGPDIVLPPALTEGVAWEESGWQSTIVSCDGGIGLMQVMADTAAWANTKFGTDNDVHTLSGNAAIGSAYLQWLTKYYGDAYFNGDYSLAPDPDKLALLDCVIAAYQAGFGTVDNSLDGPKHTLPNWWYVNAVEQFMMVQPWTNS